MRVEEAAAATVLTVKDSAVEAKKTVSGIPGKGRQLSRWLRKFERNGCEQGRDRGDESGGSRVKTAAVEMKAVDVAGGGESWGSYGGGSLI